MKMNKILRGTVLSTVLLASSAYAEYINVPQSIQPHAVYYMRTKQLDEFSCGYNVLFNAANFETTLGFENPTHKYPAFRREVMPIVQLFDLNPRGSTNNLVAEHLAEALRLQPLYHLSYDEKNLYGVGPLVSDTVSIRYPSGTPQSEIRRRMDNAFEVRKNDQLCQIHEYLSTHEYAVVHFSCHVEDRDAGHAILVSLHQNESGRGLFVFDNLNDPMYESSQIVRFLEYLIFTFDISSNYAFSPPQVPHRWLHLDRG